MKNALIATIVLSAAAWAPAAYADKGGSCHFHGSKAATESVVAGCADQRKQALVKAGKLDATWAAVAPEKVETVDGKKGKEWKLTFKNPAVADASKQTLYMFYSLPGNFIAANFTGQ
ncbi:MAG: DUF6488 family protein [Acidovorax sp.]|uniref:DUF6488 family protein n=1 Tax=Acidovorax sp. TaxID=1872122 RepID=UPI003919EE7F